ncbi:hypothetical protein [Nosocomiicoccus ampullae]|uniref:Uncharacterized protein n=1 Tax=Nosocomiicoccus ampullae TaxID=489910 RepID=A0A9Q2CYS8_9STAP|nr:hypothetical protein [Nosocomiicoccus ampullae]MBB5175545.1 hypothetical protein [Nosocomiicoccus ampullae]QYA46950.1 hypothetical protein KPF49_00385 [Nosocomiicoccus ampullae]
MKKELRILSGVLTVYQISKALDLPFDVSKDLLEKKLHIQDLDEDFQIKLESLERALYSN